MPSPRQSSKTILAAIIASVIVAGVALALLGRRPLPAQRVFVYAITDGSTVAADDHLNALLFQGWRITQVAPFTAAPGGVLLVLEHP